MDSGRLACKALENGGFGFYVKVFGSFAHLLYRMMSGLQTESKGNRMLLMLPKSVEFHVRCVSLQRVLIQQLVVIILRNYFATFSICIRGNLKLVSIIFLKWQLCYMSAPLPRPRICEGLRALFAALDLSIHIPSGSTQGSQALTYPWRPGRGLGYD